MNQTTPDQWAAEEKAAKKRVMVLWSTVILVISGILVYFFGLPFGPSEVHASVASIQDMASSVPTVSRINYLAPSVGIPMLVIIIALLVILRPKNEIGVDTGLVTRWLICIIFHTGLAYYERVFYEKCMRISFDPNTWYYWLPENMNTLGALVGVIIFASSLWFTFSPNEIKFNEKGRILYFNKPIFENVRPGLLSGCWGLPLIGSILKMPTQVDNIVIGELPSDKPGGPRKPKVPFILPGPNSAYRAIWDVGIDVSPIDTELYFKIRDDKTRERIVVQKANAALAEITQNYPTIDLLVKAPKEISHIVTVDDSENSLQTLYAGMGLRLNALTVKDIVNEDQLLVTTLQREKIKVVEERIEKLNLLSAADKINTFYILMNEGLPEGHPEHLSKKDCIRVIEREEGVRTTTEFESTGGNKGKGKGRGRNNNPSPTPVVLLGPQGAPAPKP